MKAFLLAGLALVALQAQPVVQRFTLPNGLRVLHLEDHEHPLVRVRIHVRVEPSDTPAGHAGLPLLARRMLEHSDAADMKAEDFDRSLASSGIQFEAFSEQGGLGWRLLARSRDQDRALGLLANRLLRTTFDAAVLEAQRLACWQEWEQSPLPLTTRPLDPPAQRSPDRVTQASLGFISMESLLAFRAQVCRPERTILVLHGDLGLEQAKRLVLLSLGSWSAAQARAGVALFPGQARNPSAGLTGPGTPGSIPTGSLPATPPSAEVMALLELLLQADPALANQRITAEAHSLAATSPTQAQVGRRWFDSLESRRQRGYEPRDLERAKAAWLGRRKLDALHPEALLEAALTEAQGRAAAEVRLQAVSLETLNAGLRWNPEPPGTEPRR